MTFTESISSCLSKYATVAGRATRSEYWWFYLFFLLLSWGSSIAGAVAGGEAIGLTMSVIVGLALFVPTVCAATRRLHDTKHSGWWQLIAITIIGAIPLIIWLASEGEATDNQYGPPTRA